MCPQLKREPSRLPKQNYVQHQLQIFFGRHNFARKADQNRHYANNFQKRNRLKLKCHIDFELQLMMLFGN